MLTISIIIKDQRVTLVVPCDIRADAENDVLLNLNKKYKDVLVAGDDMRDMSVVSAHGIRAVTKRDVLRVARVFFSQPYANRKGFKTNMMASFRLLRWLITAPWKSGQPTAPSHEENKSFTINHRR